MKHDPVLRNQFFRKSKMADDRHRGFRFSAVILASINIYAPHLVPRWKINSPRGPSAQISKFFFKSKMVNAAILDFLVQKRVPILILR